MQSKEQYVIGINHSSGIWFYVGESDGEGSIPANNRFSSTVMDAKIFDSHDEAMSIANKQVPKEYVRWILKVFDCPICKKKFAGHPALSRKDNKAEICPDCGVKEAIEIAMKNGLVKKQK